jgi:hypothetical protein
MVGEMDLSHDQIPAEGLIIAEVVVWVFEVCRERRALHNIDVMIHSSRNQDGSELDYLEQPIGPTDADGMVVAYVGSYNPGEATLFATANGDALCKTWSNTECLEPLQRMITFIP